MASIKSEKLIRLSKSCLSDAEKQAVMNVLNREFLGMGTDVQKFEEMLAHFFERPVVCVSTGTAALHLALQSIGVGLGDEVLVQSLTYVASFQAISATGAKPIACDVDPETFCLDWKDAENRLTPNTKAVMPVHYSGGVGELNEIYAFAKKYDLRVIEDAAHAFGTEYQDKRVGSFGDIACFSFDGIKNITSGEGGCIVTDDQEVLRKIQDARLLGVERDTEKRYLSQRSWDFDVTRQGWRYHMSNVMAAIGIVQLSRFISAADKRITIVKHYIKRLSDSSKLRLLPLQYGSVVPHIFVIELLDPINRDRLRKKLLDNNIETGIHYQPNHWLTLYKDDEANPLPITDSYYQRLLTLPLHTDLTISEVDFVCDRLLEEIQ